MSGPAPGRLWWTAEEIALAALPDLPRTKRRVNALVKARDWQANAERARRRKARGGGWEYHWSLFPARAQRALLVAAEAAAIEAPDTPDRDAAWIEFEALPDTAKAEAARRLRAIQDVEALERAGQPRSEAIKAVEQLGEASARTLWRWFGLVDGVRIDDRLPRLAPRHRAGERAVARAPVDPGFGALIKSDYLRVEKPSLTSVYDRAVRVAAERGLDVAPLHTVRRWLAREVSEATMILMREGADALKARYPAQVRDKTAMHALEGVNADFHRFDVFVRWPAGPGEAEGRIERPQMVAFQDIYSGRLLSWRVDRTPNAQAVKLAAGDMIETWGIPEHVLLDNGREFAAKEITGGAPTRFRFTVREDDLPGLFVSLGCHIHWATPYSGQSKPVERAFRDLCDRVAKDPRLAGAYTGNRPDAKPENYRSRAVPLDEFLAVLAEGIELHNTRQGRRSEVAWGRSFAEVFDDSYASAPIRKATQAQRRLWLMGAEGLRADSRTGELRFQGNRYWADWLHMHLGEKLVGRFDPAALWDGLHVYRLTGEYLGLAECREKAGFFDIDDARTHARARRDWMKAERRAAEAHRQMTSAELGAALDETAPEPAEPVEAKVVRPVFAQPAPAPREIAPDPALDAAHEAVVADLTAIRGDRPDEAAEDERTRFQRALELIRSEETGQELTKEQAKWLAVYRTTPEFRGQMSVFEDFGDEMFRGMKGKT